MRRFRVTRQAGVQGTFGAKPYLAAVMALVASATPLSSNDTDTSPGLPGRIDAQYSIALSGFDLGQFTFEQRGSGQAYSLKSVVELSALLGAFEWRGITQTQGRMTDKGPQPKQFAFDFRSKAKGGLVRMQFEHGNVTSRSAIPSLPETGTVVPLKAGHTRSVLDPLSAILSLSHSEGAGPCNRTLPIFDGKQRFNLTFNFIRHEALPTDSRQNGRKDRGIVCQIKYKPLGGFVANSNTSKYAAEDNIEIAFRSFNGGRLMVPYRLTLPTVIGTARLDLKRLSIGPNRSRMAAVQN